MTPGVRIRGRAGQAARARRLKLHPFCRRCDELGFIRPTAEIDHVVSLAFGGADVDENTQGLCVEHHAEKTAAEMPAGEGASNWPAWLEPSLIPVVLVCGPPGSGRRAFVDKHRTAADVVIDLDEIRARLLGYPLHVRPKGTEGLDAAIRARNVMLGTLAKAKVQLRPEAGEARAWLILSAPSTGERAWWRSKLGHMASIVMRRPPLDDVLRVLIDRGDDHLCDVARDWFRREALDDWRPPAVREKRKAIGLDGRPEGWGD